ncbi:hypothetical protein AB2B38_012890 [Balneola sp. MJW-20]|uniref:hypothetical protein n=1 Tax=Gracilimonas aurantiaca TaxID=3234185 RepID=UPI003466B865
MKDPIYTEDYSRSENKFLKYINKHASRKNDVVMFGFIFMIVFYIAVFVPTTPLSEENAAEFTNTEVAPKTEQIVKTNNEKEVTTDKASLILGSIK